MQPFQALVVSEVSEGVFQPAIQTRSLADLPPGDILIRVHYSSLNYKDALSATGDRGVTRHYPHTPGIDAAGTVVESTTDAFAKGDRVIVTGYDLGMNTAGGFADYIRVPSAWVVPCPESLSLWESMAYGTAGFTAALCLTKLQHQGITPDKGDIVVTGATGGVGSIAIQLLSRLGYRAIAVTGKQEATAYLKRLGADDILSRSEFDDTSDKALLKQRFAGAIDPVGGNLLATVIKSISYGGAIAACGLASSATLNTTVFPFILRGISLLGVDSMQCPQTQRQRIWHALATQWKLSPMTPFTTTITLADVVDYIPQILAGQVTGRIVIQLSVDESSR